jgi:cytochrome P450
MILSLMLAGRDTTASLLAWTLFFLSQHPEVEQKILDELRANLHQVQGGQSPEYDSLRNMHYLNATLTEVRFPICVFQEPN